MRVLLLLLLAVPVFFTALISYLLLCDVYRATAGEATVCT